MTTIRFYNTLNRKEEDFQPLDANHVRLYACGPTVYDRPHIGNARSAVVYDMLSRFLRHVYPKVTFVRNITDVDDKINAAAKRNGETIAVLAERMIGYYHEDMAALGCARPDVEPRATQHIAEMIAMIETLIERGHAYAAEGHVLFAVASDADYGCLSRRNRDEMIAGARVDVAPYKKDPADFVLWKPASEEDDTSSVFDSPWGKGRPGWHIECSAMSSKYLGDTFDIHGGGADLMFPHHENEIAQSTCANDGKFARYWVHNGFLTVSGEKMSKSLGNFFTVRDLLEKGHDGNAIRWAMLSTHYRKPLDWNEKLLDDATKAVAKCQRKLASYEGKAGELPQAFMEALGDDLNVPKALSYLHSAEPAELKSMFQLLGFTEQSVVDQPVMVDGAADEKAKARIAAKKDKDFTRADALRDEIRALGYEVVDLPGGQYELKAIANG